MLLYKVVIEHVDVAKIKDWEAGLQACVARYPKDVDNATEKSTKRYLLDHPQPAPCVVEKYVVVLPAFGPDPACIAASLAVQRAVGDSSCWDEYQPIVKTIEFVRSVLVAPPALKDEDRWRL